MNQGEKRHYMGEVRAEVDGDNNTIIGYGSVFNKRSENLGGFREIIAPGAFDDVLNDDVRALFNHDANIILGRSSNNTLALSVDDEGLRYEITAPATQYVKDVVLAPMHRGDVRESSFHFRVARDGDTWEEDDEGVVIRTINRVQRLFDVSPVTYPAYPDAAAGMRSMNAWKEACQSGAVKRAINERQSRERVLALLNC